MKATASIVIRVREGESFPWRTVRFEVKRKVAKPLGYEVPAASKNEKPSLLPIPEGTVYYVKPSSKTDPKRIPVKVGTSFEEAHTAYANVEADLARVEKGLTPITPAKEPKSEQTAVPLLEAIERYLTDIECRESSKYSYRKALTEFASVVNGGTTLSIPPEDEIAADKWQQTETADKWRPLVLKYQRWLREQQHLSSTTRHGRLLRVAMMLKHFNIFSLLKKTEWPTINEGNPDPYTDEELKKLRKAVQTTREHLFIELALRTGARKGELRHATKSAVSIKTVEVDGKEQEVGLFEIKANPKYGFVPKNSEERQVTISAKLAQEILDSLRDQPADALIFATSKGQPDKNLLEAVVYPLGKRAGVRSYVHRFRDTYLTKLAQSGMDTFALRQNAGHKSSETTERYVKAAAAISAYQVQKAQKAFGD